MPTEAAAVLYDTDLADWAQAQARALELRDPDALDWDNLAEEIRDLGKGAKRMIASYLNVLLTHLIKYEIQPERRSRSWRLSIRNARKHIHAELESSPSLRPYLTEIFGRTLRMSYEDALAEMETSSRPEYTPCTLEQALDFDFLPH